VAAYEALGELLVDLNRSGEAVRLYRVVSDEAQEGTWRPYGASRMLAQLMLCTDARHDYR